MKYGLGTSLHVGLVGAVLFAMALTGVALRVTSYFVSSEEEESRNIAVTSALAEAQSALWQLRYEISQFMLGDAEARQEILAAESAWYAAIESSLDAYERTDPPEREAAALAELRTAYAAYKEGRPKFFELHGAGRIEEASAWRRQRTTPEGVATVDAFDRQLALVRGGLADDAAQDATEVEQARVLFVAVIGLLIVLLALAYWTALRALRSIRALQARAQAVVSERLGEAVAVTVAGNEVEALVTSFNLMSDAFASRSAELERIGDELRTQQQGLAQTVAFRTAALEARQRESADLAELTNLMQAAEDIDDAAQILPLMLGRLLAPHRGAVYLVRSSLNTLESLGPFGTDQPYAVTMDPRGCWALRRGHVYSASDPARDVFCEHVAPQASPAGYVCAPMQARGTSIGLLHVTLATHLDDDERERVKAHVQRVSEQVAVGIANLKLREALREQSIRDSLTGLLNRRYLEESLEQEVARATRERRPLSVIMIDVDHFKRFNDTHGHDAGDAVLRALGRVLRESVRAGDVVCRFGGEEFTAVLPGAPADQVRVWAERLMDRVRTMEVRVGGQTLPGVTVSMGLASHPTDGTNVEAILQAADLALYSAKRAGRDRLVAASEEPASATLATPAIGR